MPELRKDPIIGRWVIISTERARRPDQFSGHVHDPEEVKACPFCEGKEEKTPLKFMLSGRVILHVMFRVGIYVWFLVFLHF